MGFLFRLTGPGCKRLLHLKTCEHGSKLFAPSMSLRRLSFPFIWFTEGKAACWATRGDREIRKRAQVQLLQHRASVKTVSARLPMPHTAFCLASCAHLEKDWAKSTLSARTFTLGACFVFGYADRAALAEVDPSIARRPGLSPQQILCPQKMQGLRPFSAV